MTSSLSPCVKICVVDPLSGLCIGCGRTVAEISQWRGHDGTRTARGDGRIAGADAVRALARRAQRPGARARRVRALAPAALLRRGAGRALVDAAGRADARPSATTISPAARSAFRSCAGCRRAASRAPGRTARHGCSGASRSGRCSALRWSASYAYRFEFGEMADRVLERARPLGRARRPRRRSGGAPALRRRVHRARPRQRPLASQLVFDTGATAVVLTAEDAAAAGLRFGRRRLRRRGHHGQRRRHRSAGAARQRRRRGHRRARRAARWWRSRGRCSQSLLGMSFLERLKGFGVENGELVFKAK